MEDYYEYLDSNGVTTLYKLIKDDTVALIDSYSITVNGITTTLDTHINNSDIHTPISVIENMVDTKISGLVNSAPETLDTLKELSDALGNDPNFATTIANQIGNKANSIHNHVVSDITDFPTIPTKTSQLINDSGFLTSSSGLITSVSWSDITNKPNFSTVATSGSYTDLSNTPTIPTKLSQLENDMGFGTSGGSGDTSDCVHKTGAETITGSKTFTSGPWVTNDLTTAGYSIKNIAIARNDVPSQLYHATFRAYDKNDKILGEYCVEKSTTGCTLLNMNVRSEDSNGEQLSESLYLNMSNDGSKVRFYPSSNNKMDLGMSNHKWAKIYSDDVVHTSGNETIKGTKTFTNQIFLGAGGSNYGQISAKSTDSLLRLFGGTQASNGANLDLYGEGLSSGGFSLRARTSDKIVGLDGKTDGTLTWNGKDVALDENLVHKSGNETISGVKTFKDLMYIYNNMSNKNSQMDLFTTPANTLYAHYMFVDKNDEVSAYMQYGQQNSGTDFIGLFIHDKNRALHGIQVTTNKEVIPIANNTYNLGTSGAKWKNVYATTYYGNLVGGITLNQSSLKMTVKDSNSETTRTNDVLLANSSNTSYGINVAFGGSGNTVVGAGESYTAQLNELVGSSQENLYLTADNNIFFKVGANTFANAKTITISSAAELSGLAKVTATTFVGALTGNVTGNCSGSSSSCTGNSATATSANSATYAITQATTDNSTKIATTAWVRTYVNSVAGSNTVGSSVSAYWSNSSLVTATGNASASGTYPACYSEYITKTPTVGTIYSGAQLYTKLAPYASATASTTGQDGSIKVTNITAQATFSNPISSTGKYLCTTANTVKFRAYVTAGNSSSLGTSSVVDNSSTKSIFIRIE